MTVAPSAAPSTDTDGRRPIKRALVSVYDKTGLAELARALDAAGVAHRVDRLDGDDDRRRGGARDAGRGADRLPGVPRRPGQDASPEGARRHPRRHAQPRPRPAARRPRRRALRPRRRQPLSVPRDRRLGCERGRVRRADRHRRPVDGAGRGQEPRKRRHRDEPGGIRPRDAGPRGRRLHAGGASTARGRGVRAHGRATTPPSRTGWAPSSPTRPTARASRPGPARPSTARPPCATARTRTSRPRSTATGVPVVACAEQLHGKEMSYNNYVDTDAAVRAAHDHGDQPTVAIIKHANPCGIAIGATIEEAYERAHATDPVSAYGGIIAANRTVTAAMAAAAKPVFTEVIIAPDYEPEALEILTAKKNLRILRLPAGLAEAPTAIETRAISGGLLVQTVDKVDAVVRGEGDEVTGGDDAAALAARGWGGRRRGDDGRPAVRLAGDPRREVQRDPARQGRRGGRRRDGPGQPRRLLLPRRAPRGEERARGSVAASDAFFPFADGLQILLDAGVAPSSRPAARSATTRSSRRPRRPASRCTSPAPATSPTDPRERHPAHLERRASPLTGLNLALRPPGRRWLSTV